MPQENAITLSLKKMHHCHPGASNVFDESMPLPSLFKSRFGFSSLSEKD